MQDYLFNMRSVAAVILAVILFSCDDENTQAHFRTPIDYNVLTPQTHYSDLFKDDRGNPTVDLVDGNNVEEIKKMKQTPGHDMTILGSGSIISQFAEAGLIDLYQFMVDPVVLGEGTSIFDGVSQTLNLKLVSTKSFKSGVVLLAYEPLKN